MKSKAKYLDIEPLANNVICLLSLLNKLKLVTQKQLHSADVEEFMYRMVYIVELEFPTVTRAGYRQLKRY